MQYPNEHKKIVSNLLDGKFIISSHFFDVIKEQEDEYIAFFKNSYGYDLKVEADFAYLTSDEVKETRTRDFVLFLAVLCRELDYSGRNFRDTVEFGSLDISDTFDLLKQSSKWEILEKTTIADFEKFITTWTGKNLLIKSGSQFKFTKAVNVFLSFAVNIANAKMKEEN
ncbi:MAG: condensin complex protein MksE [Bacteroidales bacterium]